MTSRRETLRGACRSGRAQIVFACCAALFGLKAEAVPVFSGINDMRHLSDSGYLPEDDPGSEEIISILHSRNNLNGTILDSELSHVITLFEDFHKGIVAPETDSRRKRYIFNGSKWDKKTLTYRITKYTDQLDKKEVDDTIAKAFAVWSRYTDLTFSTSSGEVDIEISFERGDHGDGHPFLGSSGNTIGHGFYPWYGGDIHFNDDKNWTTTSYNQHSLLSAAVSLTSWSLGLTRSNATSSVTNNGFVFRDPNSALPSDDIEGIQALYGPKSVEKVPEMCGDFWLDTMFRSADGHLYVFKGKYYWNITDPAVLPGYPKLIATTWSGLPDSIDFAYTNKLGETYFFKGLTYWKYLGQRMDTGWPKEFADIKTPTEIALWKQLIVSWRRNFSYAFGFLCYGNRISSALLHGENFIVNTTNTLF